MTDRFVTVPDSLELPAAVKVPVARLSDSTPAGRALLTGADAAAQRTSLGLGTAAQHAHGDYATAAQGTKADATEVQQITLTAPLALTVPAGFPAGQVYRVTLTQDGTGGHTVTYDEDPVTVDLTAGAQTEVELWPNGTATRTVVYPGAGVVGDVSAAVESYLDTHPPVASTGPDIYVDADYTGVANASVILQAACDLGASAGRRVVMGAGTLKLETPIAPASRLHLVGQGMGNTTIRCPYNASAFYRMGTAVDPMVDVTFEDFKIDGAAQLAFGISRKGFFFTYARRIHINRVHVANTMATGIGIDFVTGQITNCWLVNCGRGGSTTTGGSSGIGIGTGALSAEWEPLAISGCHAADNMRYGIFLERQSALPAGISVIGCTATGNQHGFGDSGGTGARWVGCTAYDNDEAGFGIDTGTYVAGTPGVHTTVSACYANANQDGVLIEGLVSGEHCDAVRVSDNTLIGNTRDGVRVNFVSPASCTRLVVEDNSIYDNGAYGVRVTGTGTFTNVSLVGNSCNGNTAGGVLVEPVVSGLLATTNDVRSGGGVVNIAPTGSSVTTGNFGTFTVAEADTAPPSAPSALTATPASASMALAWTAATDNVAVTAYRVSSNNGASWITSTVTATSCNVTGLTPSTSYTFAVQARDAAGNWGASATVTEATTATTDTENPTTPTGLNATSAGATSVGLSWSASTDNVAVTGYEYRVDGGAAVDAGAGLTETVGGLTASTSYTFEVRAYDAAGNRSAWSASDAATTDAAAALSVQYLEALSNDGALSNKTFTGVGFGAEDASRAIVAVIGTRDADALSSVTIGGVTATLDVSTNDGEDQVYIARAVVPTGTTGTVALTWAASVARHMVVLYRVVGGTLAKVDQATATTDAATMTVTVPSGGFAIAGATAYSSAATDCTWTGATEGGTAIGDAIIYTSAASTLTSGDVGIVAAWSVATDAPVSAAVAYSVS